MMKELFFVLFSAVFFVACSLNDRTSVTGKVNGPQYEGQYVYMYDAFHQDSPIDSAKVSNQKFQLSFPDQLAIYSLSLKANKEDYIPVILPFVAGEGHVNVVLGDVVVTTGTPSNDSLQDFLLAGDQIFEQSLKSGDVEEVKKNVKQFVLDQISLNKFSIVSAYILHNFKSRLTVEEIADIKSKMASPVSKFLD